MTISKFITSVTVTDPDTQLPVEVLLYKEQDSGGIFGLDASYVEQQEPIVIPSPFQNGHTLLTED